MVLVLLKTLISQAGMIVILALFISRFRLFRTVVSKETISRGDLVLLAVLFGVIGIGGTYWGIPVKGALANTRVVGVFVGGLVGGPLVGLFAGLIAGTHRWMMDIGGFTAFACMVSTIAEGLLAGALSRSFHEAEHKWLFALLAGLLAETMQMMILLVLVRPFHAAWDLVQVIGLPMIVANAVGIGMFVAILEGIIREQDRIAARQAETVLGIANQTLAHFRRGFTPETTASAARIIREMSGVAAVAFTDRAHILAHVGTGQGHHRPGAPFLTTLTMEVIRNGEVLTAETKAAIGCREPACRLRSAVTVPLKKGAETIGTLKLYKTEEHAVTDVDIRLATGLADLFSTQLELSRIEEQEALLDRAELQALQAQINPHFLFNALNTIVSLIRTRPDRARELLITLGEYFRTNLQHNPELVDLETEIGHVNSYLALEKARYGDRLQVVYDLPRDITCRVPPLILQPLVENAVKHGLMARAAGGTIRIRAAREKAVTVLSVSDDGVGMSATVLDALPDAPEPGGSVGLNNVHRRLINRYGAEYGLRIESVPEEGTTVTMRIPECGS